MHRFSLALLLLASVASAEDGAATPAAGDATTAPDTSGLDAQLASGEAIFGRTCITCHRPDGLGIPGAFPPLAGSDFLFADIDGGIRGVITGRNGPITVNGASFNGVMPAQNLNDAEIADVVTYVLHAWGNDGPAITADHVADIRAAVAE